MKLGFRTPGLGRTDYRLAKRAVVRKVTAGELSPRDVCDAHPELLRAARNIGATTARHCPICSLADERAEVPRDENDGMRLVTYVFGPTIKQQQGHCVWREEELAELSSQHDSLTAYVVECCLVCGWNHLVESFPLGRKHR